MTYKAMTCPLKSDDTTDVLLDYAAGRLDRERTAVLEHHMASCEACAEFGARQSALWRTLDEWEPAPVSMDFDRRLWARIDSLGAQPWHRRFAAQLRFGAWKPAIPLAAAALVVAAGFVMDQRSVAPLAPAAGGNGVSIMEVDQVERTLDDIQLLKQLDPPGSDTGAAKAL